MLWFVYKGIVNRKLRNFLSSIGIAIGIFAIFSMLSIGRGIFIGVEESIKEIGADKIMILPRGFFTKGDINVIEKVDGVDEVLPLKVSYFTKGIEMYYIYGIDLKKTKEMFVDTGYVISEGRYIQKKREVIIGSKVKEKMDVDVGDRIDISGKEFKIVGVLQGTGSRFDDFAIMMSEEDFDEIFKSPGYQFVIVKVMEDPEVVAKDVEDELEKHRGVKDFEILTQENIMQRLRALSNLVLAFFLASAIISLLVGAIGVMNSIYTSVHERIKIIGLLRAIGASRSQIMKIFLLESILVSLIGCLIGLSFGTFFVLVTEKIIQKALFPTYKAVIVPQYYFYSLIISVVFGVVAGFLPARSASKIPPAEALRYE